MLVLTRKKNDAIVLNTQTAEEIRITCVDIGGGKVRIGIDAPQSVSILRGELEVKSDSKADREKKTAAA